MKDFSVGIVIPMRNSQTTIIKTLESLIKQRYLINKIVIVDNASSDDSVKLVYDFIKKSKTNIQINVIKRTRNKGVGESYNVGVSQLTTDLVVCMHSDGILSSTDELRKLTAPFHDRSVVATYSTSLMPLSVWKTFNFWQMAHFCRVVDKKDPGFTGKFDCVRRKEFLIVGGFNQEIFGEDIALGGEDADLYLKLSKRGRVILSEATVIHLHYMGSGYSFTHWMYNRKLLARTYGRIIRLHAFHLPITSSGIGLTIPLGFIPLFIKPVIAVIPFIPGGLLIGLVIFFIYSLYNSFGMYSRIVIVKNWKLVLLPSIDAFFVYYESYWLLTALLFAKDDQSGTMSRALHP